MKKIKDNDKFYEGFNKECNKIKDFRLKVLFIHLHIEYLINKIIEIKFPKPDMILKDGGDLKFFSNKLKILEALGGFPDKDMCKKISLINRIRNFYSHNIVKKDDYPQEITNRIHSLFKDCFSDSDDIKNISHNKKFIQSCYLILGILHGYYIGYSYIKNKKK